MATAGGRRTAAAAHRSPPLGRRTPPLPPSPIRGPPSGRGRPYRIEVEVELRDHEHLHNLLTALEAESDVAQVSRVRDPALKP